MPKIVQSIYQSIKVSLPLNSPIKFGTSQVVFTNNPLKVLKITGRPSRITDDGVFLAPEISLVNLHKGNYLVIETACANDSDEQELRAREENEAAAAWMSLSFGKRVAEKLIGINVFPEPGKLALVSHPERNPMAYPLCTYSKADLDFNHKLAEKHCADQSDNGRTISLALRWYLKGRNEELPSDAYLAFWVSLEVLFGEWKDMDKRISEELSEIIPGNHSSIEVKEALGIGRLLGQRADIVHKGKISLKGVTENERVVLLREITEEILRKRIGLKQRDRFSKYFQKA